MKTKLVKFEAPKESTIYNPPLKIVHQSTGGEFFLVAYIVTAQFPFVCKENTFMKIEPFEVEVPEEPQRMTCLQVLQLLNRGEWIVKTSSGEITANIRFDESIINDVVGSIIRVSRIDKIEWIEPTTELLDL